MSHVSGISTVQCHYVSRDVKHAGNHLKYIRSNRKTLLANCIESYYCSLPFCDTRIASSVEELKEF